MPGKVKLAPPYEYNLLTKTVVMVRAFANNSLFMDIATILWALTIEPMLDDKGQAITPDPNVTDETGIVMLVF